MSRINAPLKRNINIPDENDVLAKTPFKPSRQFGTPLKASITPSLIKPTPKTPGLNIRSKTFLGNNAAFTTPIRKPDFEVFEDENDENEIQDVQNKSPDPHLSPVEEDDDEIDTCVGHPIHHIHDDDFDFLKNVEHIDLYDESEESFRKIYGNPSEIVIEDFVLHLPDTPEKPQYEDDGFFDFLERA